jgi:glycosyltransferase involved in cell wall biosynthesis
MTPRVSVCIPTYNGQAYLGPAIESVLAQTLTDLEVVVIDDGSTDATPDVVARLRDPRLRYLRNERNLGPQGNWNRCLEEARGRYFKLLPHDDLLRPTCLERQVAVLEADRDERIALVACARDVIGPDERVLMRRGFGPRDARVPGPQAARACVRRGTNLIGEPGAGLARLSLVRRVGAYDGSQPYVIDLDYWFRLLEHGDLHCIAEPLAAFRVSSRSWSVAIGARQTRDFREFVHRMQRTGRVRPSALDHLAGSVSTRLNTLARLAFYRLHAISPPARDA